ncbi:MAG: PDZ domain-containing protein [Phycisphaerae bacterium]|nr:PDZ domain-containing protein [Phycisphaerae bacterium]
MRAPVAFLAAFLVAAGASAQQVDIFRAVKPSRPNLATSQLLSLESNEELKKRAVSDKVAALVVSLSDRAFEKRREATIALRDDAIPLEELLSVLARGGLPVEGQHRLVAIVSERILTRPVGALGVQMDVGDREGGVLITNCIPGMPAEAHLKPGDRVVAIDGRAIHASTDLTDIVQSMSPGTPVRVEAIRTERGPKGELIQENGAPKTKRIDVTFPLGSSRQLESSGTGTFARAPVSQERQDLAREVRSRFSPVPVVVEMPEDREALKRFAALDPDTHPDVQGLKRLIEIYKAERRAWDAQTLNALEATLTNLRRQANDSTYAESQREWFRRVAKRYEELLPKAE